MIGRTTSHYKIDGPLKRSEALSIAIQMAEALLTLSSVKGHEDNPCKHFDEY